MQYTHQLAQKNAPTCVLQTNEIHPEMSIFDRGFPKARAEAALDMETGLCWI